jgi:hypothetical protein
MRDLQKDFACLSMHGTKSQQLTLKVNVFVSCPILPQKDIEVFIMRLLLLHGASKMLIGSQKKIKTGHPSPSKLCNHYWWSDRYR